MTHNKNRKNSDPLLEIFKEKCTVCGGTCCKQLRRGPVISNIEKEQITDLGYRNFCFKVGQLYEIKNNKGGCVFLQPDGCLFQEDLRPLDCLAFPVVFNQGRKQIKSIYRNKVFCPPSVLPMLKEEKYEEMIMNTIKTRLQNWDEGEIKAYSKLFHFKKIRMVEVINTVMEPLGLYEQLVKLYLKFVWPRIRK